MGHEVSALQERSEHRRIVSSVPYRLRAWSQKLVFVICHLLPIHVYRANILRNLASPSSITLGFPPRNPTGRGCSTNVPLRSSARTPVARPRSCNVMLGGTLRVKSRTRIPSALSSRSLCIPSAGIGAENGEHVQNRRICLDVAR